MSAQHPSLHVSNTWGRNLTEVLADVGDIRNTDLTLRSSRYWKTTCYRRINKFNNISDYLMVF